MKELSIKERAKAYDEAIERAKKLYGNEIAEEIFTELKESEDEKIRKEIISIIRNVYWTSNRNRFNELVAWLEKQGETSLILSNSLSTGKNEQKSIDKIKPRFKVGDKIVDTYGKYMGASVTQGVISKITDDKYIFSDGSYTYISNQDILELVPNKKPKFDPKTLNHFDKVLTRDANNASWFCRFFSHIMDIPESYRYATSSGFYRFCIPYNEETKHLVGTTEEAPEFYRYWED